VGKNVPTMLANTQICMDWGYWLPSLLYDFFTPSGVYMLGIIECFPSHMDKNFDLWKKK